MPVLDSTPHEITKRAEATPYGCKDREHKRLYTLKQRHYGTNGYTYSMVDTLVEHNMPRSIRCSKCRFHLASRF